MPHHPELTPTQAALLDEYALLARQLKLLVERTKELNAQQDPLLLARLRALENKIGLVFTLFKASIWSVINEQNIAGEPLDPSASNLIGK